jgi:hypothetical protein
MNRMTYRRRPEFESLESMVLLSGVAAAGRHAAAALVATRPVTDALVSLSGTAAGTYRSGKAAGSPVTFTARGSVSPLGKAKVTGSLQLSIASPTGTMTIAAGHNKVFANLSTKGLGAPVFINITITGGAGKFAGASGSGEAIVNIVPANGKGPAHGHLTITFQPLAI